MLHFMPSERQCSVIEAIIRVVALGKPASYVALKGAVFWDLDHPEGCIL